MLLAFELAERQAAAGETATPLNFVVIGGGPTGVELAGTLAEISRHALAHEFRSIDPARTHIVLIEGGPRVLAAYADDLIPQRGRQIEAVGCGSEASTMVTQVQPGAVCLGNTRLRGYGCVVGGGGSGVSVGQGFGGAGGSGRHAFRCKR